MEVATIDWKDSKFEKDELYEDINAPQWIDLSANHPPLEDDEAWFCRPECNHPKTADEFFIKHQRYANFSEISLQDDQNQSTPVKKKETPMKKISKNTKYVQDSENQNPNFLTPKEHFKSSTGKKKAEESCSIRDETPRKLKSTFSARNLFAGNNIFNQITEFCNELKKMATRKKERGDENGEKEKEIEQKIPEVRILQEREFQKKPLLEARKKRNEVLEKRPITENSKKKIGKDEERALKIRATKATPLKSFLP